MEFIGYKVYGGAAEILLGIIATATSLALVFQSIPTFWRIIRKTKSTNELDPYIYMAIDWSFLMWTLYATPESRDFQELCLLVAAGVGLNVESLYKVVFAAYPAPGKLYRMLLIEGLKMMMFITMSKRWGDYINNPQKKEILGPVATIIGIIMYASPIISVIKAYIKKSAYYLPFQDCAYLFLNAVAWFCYTSLPATYDHHLAIANGAGAVLVIIQLLVACMLYVKFQDGNAKTAHVCGVVEDDGLRKPLLEKV